MALTFNLSIDCSGPTFADGTEAGRKEIAGTTEVPRILRDVASVIESTEQFRGTIFDSNGVKCGSWGFTG